MCTATSAASAGLQIGSQYGAAKGEERFTNLQRGALTDSAKDAYAFDRKQILRNQTQLKKAEAQKQVDTRIKAMELEAAANVMAGEGGVSGISVSRLMRDVKGQEGKANVRRSNDFEAAQQSLVDRGDVAAMKLKRTMMSLPIPAQPNLMGIAVGGVLNNIPDTYMTKIDDYFKDLGKN